MSSSASSQPSGQAYLSWFVFGLMASVTFVGILSELVPSGILPEMAQGLGIEDSQVGFLVGVYALASAICAIPLISLTLAVNRKTLLLVLLSGFAVSNIVVGLSSSYTLIVAMRIVGGICAGIMWPMIAAYGTALVPASMHGKAITIIMSGNTFGVSLGLPLMTFIGTHVGWRTEFIVLGVVVSLIGFLALKYLPDVPGEKRSQQNSPFAVLQNKGVLIVLLLTFFKCYGTLWQLYLHYPPSRKNRFCGRYQSSLVAIWFGFGSVRCLVGQDY